MLDGNGAEETIRESNHLREMQPLGQKERRTDEPRGQLNRFEQIADCIHVSEDLHDAVHKITKHAAA